MKINDVLKYTIWAGLFAGLFIPFVVADGQLFPFITGKAFAFRIGVEILFVVWLWLAVLDRSYRPRFSWILGAVLIFTGVMGIANAFGVNPYKSFWSNYERMEGYITILHLAAYFLIASSVLNTRKLWNAFFATSVSASVIMCFYGFAQLLGKVVINQGGVRLDGTLGNAIYLAAYMMFNMFLATYLFAQARQWSLAVRLSMYVPIVLMQGIILYYTATRGVILGLIGGVVLTAILLLVFAREQKKLRLGAFVVCGVIALSAVGFFAARNTDFVQNSPTLARFASLSWGDIKNQGRYYIWPMAIEGLKERPVFGWGQEGFNQVFNKYYNPAMYTQEAWFDRTHNMFLDWLVAGGLLGFASYLSLFVFLLYFLWKSNTLSFREKAVLTGLVGAYMFQGLFAFDNLLTYFYFFSLLAFMHSLSVITQNKEPVRWFNRFATNETLAQYVVLPLVTVGVAVVLYMANVKPILASQTLISALKSSPEKSIDIFKKVFSYNTFGSAEAAEQMYINLPRFTAQSVNEGTRKAFEDLGIENLKKQVERSPNDTRYLLFLGGFLSRIGRFEEALPYLERAQQTSPRKQAVLFELGATHANLKHGQEALVTFKQAYDLDNSFVEAKILYAIGALYAGNQKLSDELLKTIDPRTVAFEERLVQTYVDVGLMNKAVELLKKRIEFEPQNAQYRFSLAAGYLQVGNRQGAIQQLLKAAEIEPRVSGQVNQLISDIQAGRI